MSVGGKVTEVIILNLGRVYINTDDHGDKCAIYVELDDNSKKIVPGDIVWWQGSKAFWTTEDRKAEIETVLKRFGCSGVDRPGDNPEIKSIKVICCVFPSGETFWFEAEKGEDYLKKVIASWKDQNPKYCDTKWSMGVIEIRMPQDNYIELGMQPGPYHFEWPEQ